MTQTTTDEAIKEFAKHIMCELDTGGANYMGLRCKISQLSGVSPMAITMDDHLARIKERLERLEKLERAYEAA